MSQLSENIEQILILQIMYADMMDIDLSEVDFSSQDISFRDFGRTDFSGADLSQANLIGANLSESLMLTVDLTDANLSGANLSNSVFFEFGEGSLAGADLSYANLSGIFGDIDLSVANVDNATCPDGTIANSTGCHYKYNPSPTPLLEPLFLIGTQIEFITTPFNVSIEYMGLHEYIPGLSSPLIADSVIICLLYTSPSPRD